MKHYQSLIRFLEYAQISYSNITPDWNRIKRVVNAEFAMQTDGIITVDDYTYTKNDILQQIEDPNIDILLQYHILVWEQPVLLNTLEKLEWFEAIILPLPNDVVFLDWLSPYFALVFQKNLQRYLQLHELSKATELLHYSYIIAPEDEDAALAPIRNYLDKIIKLFRNLNDKSFKTRTEELNQWLQQPWAPFLNSLPESLWSYTDDVANELINFTVRIQDANKKLCYQISEQLVALQYVNYSYRELIRSNHSIYKERFEKTTLKGRIKNIPSTYMIVFFMIVVLRFVGKGSSCNEKEVPIAIPSQEHKIFNVLREEVRATAYHMLTKDSVNLIAGIDALPNYTFNQTPIYLRWDPLYKGDLYTLKFKNNTDKLLYIDLCGTDHVFTYEIKPREYYYITSKAIEDIDFVIHQDSVNMDWANLKREDIKTFQYLYLTDTNSTKLSTKFKMKLDANISLSDQKQPTNQQIENVITFHKNKERYYFTILQNAFVVIASGKHK